MKVAVVTPYFNESRATIERCIESVRAQTNNVDHFLVADGKPQDWINYESNIRHLVLESYHHDYGATPRLVGFLTAISESYDAVAFLDADCWLSCHHVASCIAANDEREGVDIVIAERSFYCPDGTILPLTSEEVDSGFLATSCHFVLPGAYHMIAKWGTGRKPYTTCDDNYISLYGLPSERFRTARTGRPTVHTTVQHESVYRFIDETPPEAVQQIDDQPIWLLGDGRSGTTWLFELLNHHYRYRAFFEPFNPGPSKPGAEIGLHKYLHPDESHFELEKHLADIFAGTYNEYRRPTPRSALFHRVLVKDIYANLFAYWAKRRFPNVKIVLLIRHPFAVAASKLKVSHWFPRSDMRLLISQERLVEDHLNSHLRILDKITREDDFMTNQIAIWAVINSVLIRQFEDEELLVVRYEDLIQDPTKVLREMFGFLNGTSNDMLEVPSHQVIDRPSSSTVHRSGDEIEYVLPSAKPEKWELVATRDQMRSGRRILSEFGFDSWYF